jgi:ubiquinone/menaquinone biosynthesis C-methylase UbiE
VSSLHNSSHVAHVNYDRQDVAHRYAHGRALDDTVLARWGAAVTPLLPDRPVDRVLDLGAGTGIFARAWPRWTRSRVVAVEPATPMRDEMRRTGLPEQVQMLSGTAQHLPLRDTSVDVAWLSAVIHHLSDLPRCVVELRRVLTGDGVVLIRGLFADLGWPSGVQIFPGWRRALAAFPATTAIDAAMATEGLRRWATVEVEEHGPGTAGEAIERVRRLRHADTLLRQFTDEEITKGSATLRRYEPDHPLPPSRLGLLAFTAADR